MCAFLVHSSNLWSIKYRNLMYMLSEYNVNYLMSHSNNELQSKFCVRLKCNK